MAGVRGSYLYYLLIYLLAALLHHSTASPLLDIRDNDDDGLTTLTTHVTTTDAHHHKHTTVMTTVVSNSASAAATTAAAAASASSSSSTASSATSSISSSISSTVSSTSTASAAATQSPAPDNGIFPASMSYGSTIGAGVGFVSLFLIVGAAITVCIWHRNKRRRAKYQEEEEKRLSSWPSDVQQPFPDDPRGFRHTLWAPEHRYEAPSSPIASPKRTQSRRSARLLGRLNGLSKKSLPPLPERES